MDKTVGKCCKNLGVSVSPEELQLSYRSYIQNGHKYTHEMSEDTTMALSPGEKAHRARIFQDIHLIYPMLKFLYADNTHPNGDVKVADTVYHYSCRHSDDKLKKCGIYDIRPRMCVTFPSIDGTHCKYTGCACPSDGRKEFATKEKLRLKLEKAEKDLAWKMKNCKKPRGILSKEDGFAHKASEA